MKEATLRPPVRDQGETDIYLFFKNIFPEGKKTSEPEYSV